MQPNKFNKLGKKRSANAQKRIEIITEENMLQFCDCHYEKSEILLKIFHPFIFLQEFHQKQT